MSWPEYPYSGVANDESHSLAPFTNDPWWKWFRNWKHLSNRARVLAQVRYRSISVPYDADGRDTTELVRIHLTCQPLDRLFVVFPYFLAGHEQAPRGWRRRRTVHINHNVQTERLDGSASSTSVIDGFDLAQPDPIPFGVGGPLALGWPLAPAETWWSPAAVEGAVGDPHTHVCAVLAKGGARNANGALSLAYRASFQRSGEGMGRVDAPLILRGVVVLGFRLADL